MLILWPQLYQNNRINFHNKKRFFEDNFGSSDVLLTAESTCRASDLNTGFLIKKKSKQLHQVREDHKAVTFCDFASLKYILTRYVSIGIIPKKKNQI